MALIVKAQVRNANRGHNLREVLIVVSTLHWCADARREHKLALAQPAPGRMPHLFLASAMLAERFGNRRRKGARPAIGFGLGIDEYQPRVPEALELPANGEPALIVFGSDDVGAIVTVQGDGDVQLAADLRGYSGDR